MLVAVSREVSIGESVGVDDVEVEGNGVEEAEGDGLGIAVLFGKSDAQGSGKMGIFPWMAG